LKDHDGSHIKGLIINFLDHFWPSLLRIPGFLLEFITPIVRVCIFPMICIVYIIDAFCVSQVTPKSRAGNRRPINFFTIPEYEQWKRDNDDGRGWTIKYYKVLIFLLIIKNPAESKSCRVWVLPPRKMPSSIFQTCLFTENHSAHLMKRIVLSLTWLLTRKRLTIEKNGFVNCSLELLWITLSIMDFNCTIFYNSHVFAACLQSVREIPISDFINKELILFS
jgi:hypothetical protein